MLMIASHRPEVRAGTLERIVKVVDGSNMASCSALWNQCIRECAEDIVIICNEKARPRVHNIVKLVSLLHAGFGLVGLYRFGFFGFYKHLINEIGWFDERFEGGWYEDNDMALRLMEADIAYYESEEVEYIQMESAWRHDRAREHWEAKWSKQHGRLMGEALTAKIDTPAQKYLGWDKSVLLPHHGVHIHNSFAIVREHARQSTQSNPDI